MTIETTFRDLQAADLADLMDALVCGLGGVGGVHGVVASVDVPTGTLRLVFDADDVDAACRGLQTAGAMLAGEEAQA